MAKKQYQVIEGKHHDDGKTYTKGQLVASSTNLVALFPGKFLEYLPGMPVPAAPAPAPVVTPADEEKVVETSETDESDAKSNAESKLGEEVTDKFPEAKEADVRVFKDGKHYFIAELEDINIATNKESLTSQAAVKEWIEKNA